MPNNNPQTTAAQQQISRAAETATKAAERLESGAENVASVAIEKVRQVREEAQSGLEQQREEIADRIRRLGGVLRAGSQTLSTDDALAQQLFEGAGDRIERVADYIANVTPGTLASDVETIARRSPGLFFGTSFILGLALGRFAKSSARAVSAVAEDIDVHADQQEDFAAPAPRASAPKQKGQSQQARKASSTAASATSSTSSPTTSTATPSSVSATLPQGVGSSASNASTSASSHTSATVGTGSASSPAVNAGPSYGASATNKAVSGATTSGDKAKSVEPGEGSKS